MNQLIKNIKQEFNINILNSIEQIDFENTYTINNEGNVTALRLMDITLKRIESLFSKTDYLKELSLVNCGIENIKFIKKYKQLEILDLSINPHLDLKEMDKFIGLKKLSLSGIKVNPNTQFKEFQNLKYLEYLDLDSSDLTSISGLENLENLETLIIGGTKIHHFDDIKTMNKLKHLDLNCCDKLDFSKINGLEKIPNLKTLNLMCCQMDKIKGLDNIKNLTNLDLGTCGLKKIEGLDNLINLEVLILEHNSIMKIEGLENLINLKELNLSNNLEESESPLVEIQGIDHLNKLENLILTGHKIKELKNLPSENLRSLDISWNKIESIDYNWIKTLKQPCLINLTGNPVEIIEKEIPEHITIITKQSN